MGGDEFTILLTTISCPQDAGVVAEPIIRALENPFVVDSHEMFVGGSIGIAVFPDAGADAVSTNSTGI